VDVFRNQLRKAGAKVDTGGGNYKNVAWGLNKEVYYIGTGARHLVTSIAVAIGAALVAFII
jgi:hypothetical protein